MLFIQNNFLENEIGLGVHAFKQQYVTVAHSFDSMDEIEADVQEIVTLIRNLGFAVTILNWKISFGLGEKLIFKSIAELDKFTSKK
jgi:hypothetical protein